MTLRLISDVHGHHEQYLELIHNVDYSLQLGDFGTGDYKVLDNLDPRKHRLISGNHDNYDIMDKYPHFLPKHGFTFFGGITFFHMQGAFSIDWKRSTTEDEILNTKTWFPNEQLTYREREAAYHTYITVKPDIVITHEAPRSIANSFSDGSILRKFGYDPETFTTPTSETLQAMLEVHRPKHWWFGHYHVTRNIEVDGTVFHCLDVLNYVDLE